MAAKYQQAGDILDIGGRSSTGFGKGIIEIRVATGDVSWEWRQLKDDERIAVLNFLNERAAGNR